MNSPNDDEDPPIIFDGSFRRRIDDEDYDGIQLPQIMADNPINDSDEEENNDFLTDRFHTDRPMIKKN